MAKKIKIPTQKNKKTQAKEDAEFLKFLESDAGTKLLGDEKKMLKLMKDTDKYLGLKF
jgi:hypothetical protein